MSRIPDAPASPRPPAISFDLDRTTREFWTDRVRQHTHDSYAGVPLAKFPEDLRSFEHIIWEQRPEVVIELGSSFGGSALWFRDRQRTLQSYGRLGGGHVITIDVDATRARESLADADPRYHETITLIEADVRDPELPARIAPSIPAGARCLVVEDTAHTYATTYAALAGFARFVHPGGFFVVEDGYIDLEERRTVPGLPRGVLPAVRDWLASADGTRFEVDRSREIYGVTSNPLGYLRRNV